MSQRCPVNCSICGMGRMGNENGIPVFRPSDYRSHEYPPFFAPNKDKPLKTCQQKKAASPSPEKEVSQQPVEILSPRYFNPDKTIVNLKPALINFPIQGDSHFLSGWKI